MKIFFYLLCILIFLGSSINAEGYESQNNGIDYVIVLDITDSMYSEEVVVVPSDFLACDEDLNQKGAITINRYSNNKGICKKITIARVALECYFKRLEEKNQIRDQDQICLFLLTENGLLTYNFEEMNKQEFFDFNEKEIILNIVKNLENEKHGHGLTPLSSSLIDLMEYLRTNTKKERKKMLIIITDLKDSIEEEGVVSICNTAKKIYSEYTGDLNIDSMMFQCIAIKNLEEFNTISECFEKYLPIAILVPISMGNAFSFQTYEKIETQRKQIIDYENKNDILYNSNIRLLSENEILLEKLKGYQINSIDQQNDVKIGLLRIFRIPMIIILVISIIGLLIGIKKIYNL